MPTRESSGGKHQWPEEGPASSISKPQSCARCGLVRLSIKSSQSSLHGTVRWYWRYSRDGQLQKKSGPCAAPKANKLLSQVIREVRHAA